MSALILLRGLPGSGKTTLAKELSENDIYPTFSIDDFFTNPTNGAYEFQYKNNHLAYQQCLRDTENALLHKISRVIVHNPFVLDWELQPYLDLGKKYSYMTFCLTVEKRHEGENIHGISEDQIVKMAAHFRSVLQ